MKQISPAWRYLEAKDFVDYCKDCRVDGLLTELEAYDKSNLFKPIRRFVLPHAYVKEIKEQPHHASPFYVPYDDGEE